MAGKSPLGTWAHGKIYIYIYISDFEGKIPILMEFIILFLIRMGVFFVFSHSGKNPWWCHMNAASWCRWQTKSFGSWRVVEGPKLMILRDDHGDEMTALNMTTSSAEEQIHVDFLMKTMDGFQKIGALYAICKPQQHINMKISMFSKELGLHVPDSVQLGQVPGNLLEGEKWKQLGGSFEGSFYLKTVDEEAAFLKSCTPEEKDEAKATCEKHLGNRPDEIHKGLLFAKIFDDCVFDICAGEGESAAQLAAAYMKGF